MEAGVRAVVVSAGSSLEGVDVPARYSVVGVVTSMPAAVAVLPTLRPDALLVCDGMGSGPGGTEMMSLIRAAYPGMTVESIGRAEERMGARREAVWLGGAHCEDLSSRSGPGVITLWGPKGGVGRTFIACNLAASIAAAEPEGVLLVDFDLKSGDVAVHLNTHEGSTILDMLPYLDEAGEGSVRRLATTHRKSGLDLVLAPGRPELSELVSPAHARRLVSMAAREYRFVVIDTPADSASEIVHECIGLSTRTILVTTQDIACLRRVGVMVDLLKRLRIDTADRTLVVANKVVESGPVSIAAMESFLGRKVAASIPEDRASVEQAIYSGIPVTTSSPDKRLGRSLRALASQIEPACATDARRAASGLLGGSFGKVRGIRSLIGRGRTIGKPS